MSDEEKQVRITAFLCNWCAYAGADLAGVSRLEIPPTVRNIRVMCSGRVNPLFVLRAFLNGADGVLVAGCHPGDCHYQRGNYYSRRRFVMIKDIFGTLGLGEERIKLSWISASEGLKYAETVRELTDALKKEEPNPTRKELFL
ncbi:MAG: hydrogenase iron-sulfur subunit [Methanomassiliicoccales archaeon]|nr:hydrogenase iron-sulfur subunit [Methanomassiliicoccales archaeon]